MDLDAYACLTSDFKVMSGLTCSGSWLDCRRTRICDDLCFQPGQSSNRVRILCKLSCVH